MILTSISVKQSLVIGAFLVFILVSALSTLFMAKGQDGDARYIGASNRLQITGLQIQNQTRSLIEALESEAATGNITQGIQVSLARYNKDIELLSASSVPPAELATLTDQWIKVADQIAYLTSASADVTSDKFYSISTGYAELWPPLLSGANSIADNLEAESSGKVEGLISLQFGILVAGMIVAVGAVLLNRRWIVSPLKNIARRLQQITTESDLRLEVPGQSKDEIGQVAKSINQLLKAFREYLNAGLAQADELTNTAGRITRSCEQLQEDSRRPGSAVSQAATATGQLGSAVHEIAQNTHEAADLASKIQQKTKTGSEYSENANQKMAALSTVMQKATDAVNQLAEQASDVSVILEVIRTIAEQTNLLALNAAIEAARAGEHGRGFAVVADEVRSLAQKTQESVKNTQVTLTSLQDESAKANQVMHEGQQQVCQGVEIVADSNQILQSISGQAAEISDKNAQIAVAVEEHSQTIGDLNKNLTGINESVNSSAEDSGQLSDSIRVLLDISVELKSSIGKFRV